MADPYLTADEIKARVLALAAVEDEVIEELVAEFEEIAESFCGVAFVERESTETFQTSAAAYDRCAAAGQVPAMQLLTAAVISVDDVTIDGDEVDATADVSTGRVYLTSPSTALVTVAITHGLVPTPKRILRACRIYVRACALRDESNVGRDVVTQAFEGGGTTRYQTPDKDNPTGYIDVDRLLRLERYSIPGIG